MIAFIASIMLTKRTLKRVLFDLKFIYLSTTYASSHGGPKKTLVDLSPSLMKILLVADFPDLFEERSLVDEDEDEDLLCH